ncbi:MAG: phosphatase PAP2 family protein [Chloroflexi bacterium]|nr:phosphatase PAP2 family protein [Chloroflexota bacterium]
MALDWQLFQLCNGIAGRSAVLDNVIRFLMNDYALATVLVLGLYALWFSGHSPATREKNQRAVFSALTATLAGNLAIKALNMVYYRPRPFADHAVRLLFYHPADSSFPSNATAVGFAIATAVWLRNRRAGVAMYVCAALLGLSRICGGVHYPSDVLGGAAVGVLSAYLVTKAHFLERLWTTAIRLMRRLLLA